MHQQYTPHEQRFVSSKAKQALSNSKLKTSQMGLKWIYSLLRSCGKNLMDLAKGTQWTSFSSGYQISLSFFIEI